jgi:DNA invertase Pin-like site-specific DNA recombinase
MTIRIYLRRSKNDEGKQQFSVDVQREGCRRFIEHRLELADAPSIEYLDDGKAGDDFHSRVGMRKLTTALLDRLAHHAVVITPAAKASGCASADRPPPRLPQPGPSRVRIANRAHD